MKVRFTARELAAKIDVSYAVASGMLSFFEDMGVAVVADKLTHWTGRGKKTRVYELDDMTTIDFGKVAAVEVKPEAVEATESVESEDAATEPVDTETVEDEIVETITVVEDEDEDEDTDVEAEVPDYVAEARARLSEAV